VTLANVFLYAEAVLVFQDGRQHKPVVLDVLGDVVLLVEAVVTRRPNLQRRDPGERRKTTICRCMALNSICHILFRPRTNLPTTQRKHHVQKGIAHLWNDNASCDSCEQRTQAVNKSRTNKQNMKDTNRCRVAL
jgi:hypothetical protein